MRKPELRDGINPISWPNGLDIVEPGIGYLPNWRPEEPVTEPLDISGLFYVGGVGRKPADPPRLTRGRARRPTCRARAAHPHEPGRRIAVGRMAVTARRGEDQGLAGGGPT
jgi:hypothetical protein